MKEFTLQKLLTIAVPGFAFLCFFSACKKDVSGNALSANLQANIPAVVVTTIAGQRTGEPPVGGSANGTGTAATFSKPFALTVDGSGNLYVADDFNYLIRTITPSVAVSTFAGNGIAGLANGTTATASFNLVYGMAFDHSGNLFLVDSYNSVIRKITPSGVVSTFAGNSAAGGQGTFKDGQATTATFRFPWGIAIDANDNLYVTDVFTIRKITPGGVVTTLAGSGVSGSANGKGAGAGFNTVEGIAIDTQGNIYVDDTGNYMIRKITPAGVVTTLAGGAYRGHNDGTGSNASLELPQGITLDAKNNIYITDASLIRKITPAGAVVTIAGDYTGEKPFGIDGKGAEATFNGPQGIVMGSDGNLYVADTDDNLIRKIVFK